MVLSPPCTCSSAVWNVCASISPTAVPACVAMALSLPCEHRGPPAFDSRDLLGRDVVVTPVVERMSDRGRKQPDEREDGEPPYVPDQGEPEYGAEAGQDDARAGVFGHMDRPEAVHRPIVTAPFHVPPGVLIVNDRRKGEVVRRWRRGRGPLQRPSVPGVAGQIAQLLPFHEAHHQVDDERQDSAQNEDGAETC